MTDFLHRYGAFIVVVLALLSALVLLMFCRLFLSSGSNSDIVARREEGVAPGREA